MYFLLKFKLLILVFFACLLIRWIDNLSATNSIDKEVLELIDFLEELNHQSTQQEFNELRIRFKKISWLFPLTHSNKDYLKINNGIYWNNTSNAGSWQHLEYYFQFKNIPFPKKEKNRIIRSLKTILRIWTTQSFNKEELQKALTFTLNQSYALGLSGRERLDKTKVIPEERAIVESVMLVGEKNNLCKKANKYSKNAINFLSKSTFNHLDRATFYKEHLLPILRIIDAKAIGIFDSNYLPKKTKDIFQFDSLQIKLGQLLFFDPLLSGNNKRTCASCHKPQKAFTDGRITSQAYQLSKKLKRNAPTLLNAFLSEKFGYGLEKEDMNAQINFVLHSPEEMNTTIDSILNKLKGISEYQDLFNTAFPNNPKIDSINLLQTISAFCSSLIDNQSTFDKFMQGKKQVNDTILLGYNLFMGKASCGTCHLAPIFNGYNTFYKKTIFQPAHYLGTNDIGAGLSLGNAFNYYYKVSGVRNLSITAPYFHNGAIVDKAEMLTMTFNTMGKKNTYNLNLTKFEKKAIIQFLDALSSNPYYNMEEETKLPDYLPNTILPRNSGGVY